MPPQPPSPWVVRWAHLVRPGGTVLDVACGSGRHLRWLAARGFRTAGVDRDAVAVEGLRAAGEIVVADIEAGPWPFAGRRFDAVVVTNYLWRPLMPHLLESLTEGGVLIYETFARGQERYGRPARAEFLLETGELLRLAAALNVVAYEDGTLDGPPRRVQRIAAIRDPGASTAWPGHPLEAQAGQ